MGNTSSATSASCNTGKCNSCSQNGQYFSFGKAKSLKPSKSFYNNRVVKTDAKGRYITMNGKKKYLPKGTKTTKEKTKTSPKRKISPVKRKVPKGYYLNKKIKSPLRKTVKNSKNQEIGSRLSARSVFNKLGMKAVGRSYPILQPDGSTKIKVLRLRQNGSPYFSNKFGNYYENNFGNVGNIKNGIHRTYGKKVKSCQSNSMSHLNIPLMRFG